MKYSSNQYAKSLYEVLKETHEKKRGDVLKNFVQILKTKKDLKKLRFIEEQLKKLFFEEKKETEAKIFTAMPVSSKIKDRIKKSAVDFLEKNQEKVKAVFEIDKTLIGGFKIKSGDYLIDGSVKNMLLKLRKNMIIK